MTEQEARRILGISAETDMQEIKKRYRRLMLQAHPDAADPSGGSCGSHTLRAREINLAYSLLKQGGSRDASASRRGPAAEKAAALFGKRAAPHETSPSTRRHIQNVKFCITQKIRKGLSWEISASQGENTCGPPRRIFHSFCSASPNAQKGFWTHLKTAFTGRRAPCLSSISSPQSSPFPNACRACLPAGAAVY